MTEPTPIERAHQIVALLARPDLQATLETLSLAVFAEDVAVNGRVKVPVAALSQLLEALSSFEVETAARPPVAWAAISGALYVNDALVNDALDTLAQYDRRYVHAARGGTEEQAQALRAVLVEAVDTIRESVQQLFQPPPSRRGRTK